LAQEKVDQVLDARAEAHAGLVGGIETLEASSREQNEEIKRAGERLPNLPGDAVVAQGPREPAPAVEITIQAGAPTFRALAANRQQALTESESETLSDRDDAFTRDQDTPREQANVVMPDQVAQSAGVAGQERAALSQQAADVPTGHRDDPEPAAAQPPGRANEAVRLTKARGRTVAVEGFSVSRRSSQVADGPATSALKIQPTEPSGSQTNVEITTDGWISFRSFDATTGQVTITEVYAP
jgi:hypothetical protein